ncbi:hypothetical protein NQ314_013265 [Rhamnusium bicolor]|uniref:Endoplasmic reticulum lectin 1 n=1 Tax=Rhamnusium bicolor TaxID=1586634 RepID=A0AAV8X9E0_9CUCU|nr:hypothetical protein NQ314_013265 [Rhamnusium bicolor]
MILHKVLLLFYFACQKSIQSDIKGFDDTILFNIDWPGELPLEETDLGSESMIVTSLHQEKYKCILPSISEKESNQELKYEGPTAIELISPLFTQTTCSFRLESYWTYEVCHGRYIRQYHEDREGKKIKVQEYFLGKWHEKQFEKLLANAAEDEADRSAQIPVKKIDNANLPYYEITMENGTLCDLNNNKPRMTKVLYVCYVHGERNGEHKISCVPLDGSPKKPYSLVKLKSDSAKLRRSSDLDRFRVELIQLEKEEPITRAPETKLLDTSPVESFLLGKHCLNGGTGWWKFEFCYGKSVEQYHFEKDGRKVSISLGLFDKQTHLNWIKEHPHKRPKPLSQRKQLSHFYAGGTVCDKTGKPRQTEVKLKCLENPPSPNAVSLYLLEPRYCEYILGVESPLICDILSRADENGLVEVIDNEITDSDDDIPTINIKL